MSYGQNDLFMLFCGSVVMVLIHCLSEIIQISKEEIREKNTLYLLQKHGWLKKNPGGGLEPQSIILGIGRGGGLIIVVFHFIHILVVCL